MNRVVITRAMMSSKDWGVFALAYMQVCAEADASDEEILETCNRENPAGTSNGWTTVVRDNEKEPDLNPKVCSDHSDRLHLLVVC